MCSGVEQWVANVRCCICAWILWFYQNNKLHAMNRAMSQRSRTLIVLPGRHEKFRFGKCASVRMSVAISFVKLKRVSVSFRSVPFHFHWLVQVNEWVSTDSNARDFLSNSLTTHVCECVFASFAKMQSVSVSVWLRTNRDACARLWSRFQQSLPFHSPRLCSDRFTLMWYNVADFFCALIAFAKQTQTLSWISDFSTI